MSDRPTTAPLSFRRSRSDAGGLRLLYLCHRTPYPPDKGCKLRAYHQIRSLARRHRIDLLTLADQPEDMAVPPALAELCGRVETFRIRRSRGYLRSALAAASPHPLTLAFFDSPELSRRVAELTGAERYDAVIAYSTAMAPYAERAEGVPKVLDMGDVDSSKWQQYAQLEAWPWRQVYALEARRLRTYEAELTARFERVVMVTSREADLLRSFAPRAPVVAIPNGVDFDYFRPFDLPKAERPTLVFTGQMDYYANVDGVVWFAREILPRLRRRFPDLEFLVVGRAPSRPVRDLADLPGVTVTGTVGDVRPFLARAWAFVAPLRIAQGIQNKVLEAMASNLPVVATGKVMAGLSDGGFVDGRHLIAATGEADLEEGVARLLADLALRRELAAEARRRLLATFSWERNYEAFDQLLTAVVASGSTVAPASRGVQSA